MKLITFDSISDLENKALALLCEHVQLSLEEPHAVMLTGGRTPLGLYRRLEESPATVAPRLRLLISDERHVPLESPDNNYGKMRAMVAALRLDESRIMRVHTEESLEAAAERYHRELASFIDQRGRITLGLLGLGADGHVASLFQTSDITRGEGQYAIAVPRPSPPDRVSVTADLLSQAERLVFLVTGPEKADIVKKVVTDPEGVVAAQAVRDVARVELWFATSG